MSETTRSTEAADAPVPTDEQPPEAPQSAELHDRTAGGGEWRVRQGQCMESIAVRTGHFWHKLWDLPENSDLKSIRKDPNTLLPGDFVHVPPISQKYESGATEAHHRFRRKGIPSLLRLRCLRYGEPLANRSYRLEIDGTLFTGETDEAGWIEDQPISPGARHGKLVVADDDTPYEYELSLGHLDPIDTTTGVKGRLRNLGFHPGPITMGDTNSYRAALSRFQRKHQLQVTGVADDATLEKLEELLT